MKSNFLHQCANNWYLWREHYGIIELILHFPQVRITIEDYSLKKFLIFNCTTSFLSYISTSQLKLVQMLILLRLEFNIFIFFSLEI